MNLNFSIANVVYVKNLSKDVTEEDIKKKFEKCDKIINISFKNFPGTNQKYCQIEFKSSEGITNASRLNGECLLNVPMVVSVIEPSISNKNINDINNENDINGIKSVINTQNQNLNNMQMLLQSKMVRDQKKGLLDFQKNVNTKNNKIDEFSKIIYMENIPENFNETHIKVLFKNIGKTKNYKIQYNEHKKMFTAFVEFETEEEAKNALSLNGLKVRKNEIIIKDSFSLINEKDVIKNNLSLFNNKDENFLSNYKPTVMDKVGKVLALKEKLTLKLCAMYNPNLLVINNLINTNPLLLNTNNVTNDVKTNGVKTNDKLNETNENLILNDNKLEIDNIKENNLNDEKENSLDIKKDKKHKYDSDVSEDINKKRKHKEKDKIKKKRNISSNENSITESDTLSKFSSKENKYTKYKRKKRKHKKIDEKYKHKNKKKHYNSKSSSYSTVNSNNFYINKKKKYKQNYESSNSSYSDSSYSTRKISPPKKTKAEKPWWVKESEKMEMRQKMKERKRMKEREYRVKYKEKERDYRERNYRGDRYYRDRYYRGDRYYRDRDRYNGL